MESAPPLAPLAAAPLAAVMPTLEYASPGGSGVLPAAAVQRNLLWLAVLSGPCVGSCFLLMYTQFSLGAKALHLLIYVATLALALRGGRDMAACGDFLPRPRLRLALDAAAGGGLMVIGVAGLVLDPNGTLGNFPAPVALLGLAFTALAVSTPRHVLLYRGLSTMARLSNRRGLARSLITLGWIKFIYEGLWLACCALPLLANAADEQLHHAAPTSDIAQSLFVLAFGALFGCMGFGGVWIAMIIVHARCVSATRPRSV